MNHHIKVYLFSTVKQRLKIFQNWFYTIHKANAIMTKVMTVEKVMWCIFNFQTTRTKRIHAVLKIMLKPILMKVTKCKRVKNFNPIGSNILYTLILRGWMNDSSLLLKTEIVSDFLIVSSNLYQSFRVEGKKIPWNTLFDSEKLTYGLSLF